MSMYSLLRSKPEPPTEAEIEETLAGNLWCVQYSTMLHLCGLSSSLSQGCVREP